jgi:MFS family permease
MHTAPPELDPLPPHVHERRWLILGVLCLSLLIIVMDNTILNVAIPSLMRELGATNSEVQWIVDSYVLVFAGLLLTTGSLSDRFGRKGALQIGIVLFGIGSAAAAMSETANQLIFTRAFMGIGGALIMPATLSILTNVFRDPTERGRAIAIWAGFSGLAVALGPMTGGFLLEHFSWHSVFWVNIPIGIVALAAGALIVPTSRDPRQPRLDPPGALLSIVGLASLLFGIIEGPVKGWAHPAVVGAFVLAAATLTAFVLWERRTATPMLDMSVFRNPRFSAASGTITIVFFALFGSLFLMTQYWQLVHGYSPLEAGVRLLPHAATMMIVAPAVGAPRRAGRHQADRAGRYRTDRHRSAPAVDHPTRHAVRRGDLVLRRDGERDGHDDGARHRVGDGIAAAGEGRRGLGGERHDPAGRWRTRRRHHRFGRVERVRRSHRRRRIVGGAGRVRRRSGRVVARRGAAHRRHPRGGCHRLPRRRQPVVRRRALGRVADLRRDPAGGGRARVALLAGTCPGRRHRTGARNARG